MTLMMGNGLAAEVDGVAPGPDDNLHDVRIAKALGICPPRGEGREVRGRPISLLEEAAEDGQVPVLDQGLIALDVDDTSWVSRRATSATRSVPEG